MKLYGFCVENGHCGKFLFSSRVSRKNSAA